MRKQKKELKTDDLIAYLPFLRETRLSCKCKKILRFTTDVPSIVVVVHYASVVSSSNYRAIKTSSSKKMTKKKK